MHYEWRPDQEFEQWEWDLIKREVRFLTKERSSRFSDREDLEDECAIAWFAQRKRYDPGRGASAETFLKWVVRHVITDAGRREGAQARRGERDAALLSEQINDESAATWEDQIGSPSFEADADTHVAKERTLGRLTERQRLVCDQLLQGHSRSQAAQSLGIHRDTLYQDLKRIQEIFRDEGLAPN